MTGKPQDKRKRSFQITSLPGWPGYRNRPSRSGLDPVDTYLEEAFIEGMFLRRLLTLQLRTKNRFYLGLMFLAGLVSLLLSIPFWAIVPLEWDSNLIILGLKIFGLLIVTGVPLVMGILLLVNFVLSTATGNDVDKSEETTQSHQEKRKHKKLPKRRKDYK
jgi:hypothetical protein